MLELSFHTDIQIGLDESIKNINSIEMALKINCGDVFIIKPQAFGSFSDVNKALSKWKELTSPRKVERKAENMPAGV